MEIESDIMKTAKKSTLISAAVGLAMISGNTIAAGAFTGIHPLLSDRFTIGAGAFWPSISGHFSIDPPGGGNGTDVDFQKDAGLDDSLTLPAFGATWRLSNRWRVQGEFFTVGQSTTHSARKILDIGGDLIEVGAKLKTDSDLDIARGFLGYSFVKTDKADMGAGLGLHYLNIDISVVGEIKVGNEERKARRGIDDWAVLPNVGAYAGYAFSPKWFVGGRVDWISANINDYDGTIWNAEATVQYQMFKHFGVGVAYRYLDFELGKDNGTKKADWFIQSEYSGPMLFFTANF